MLDINRTHKCVSGRKEALKAQNEIRLLSLDFLTFIPNPHPHTSQHTPVPVRPLGREDRSCKSAVHHPGGWDCASLRELRKCTRVKGSLGWPGVRSGFGSGLSWLETSWRRFGQAVALGSTASSHCRWSSKSGIWEPVSSGESQSSWDNDGIKSYILTNSSVICMHIQIKDTFLQIIASILNFFLNLVWEDLPKYFKPVS